MAAVTQRTYFAEGIFAEGRGPRQRFYLPWACLCRGSYPRQRPLCRGPFFAEGSCVWPSAKSLFAECPIFGPRQSLRPSAKYAFPVVKDTQDICKDMGDLECSGACLSEKMKVVDRNTQELLRWLLPLPSLLPLLRKSWLEFQKRDSVWKKPIACIYIV